MQSYNMYQLGVLPSAGGADNQPALFIDIMGVLATALAEEKELSDAEDHEREQLVGNKTGESLLNGPTAFAEIDTPNGR